MRLNKLTRTIFLLPIIGFMLSCEDNGSTDAYDTKEERETVAEGATKDEDKVIHEFVKKVASDGMMEIKLAQIAMEKSSNSSVKDLAETIKNDHQKANDKLKKLANKYNWDIPNNMLDKHQDKVDKLQDVSDDNFDEKYLETMVKGHDKAIEEFKETESSTSNNNIDEKSALNKWIEETLPVLEKHRERAQALKDQLR